MASKSKGARSVRLLGECLAVQLHCLGPNGSPPPTSLPNPPQHHYWMYDSGYLLFQGFLEANLKCFWDGSLVAAVRGLEYRGYVCPGVLLVSGNPCALEVLRAAWTRNLLKPPSNYTITLVGDVEECLVSKVQQGGFTPLPDAVCWVVLQLGASGQNAVLDTIKFSLANTFPSMEQPSTHLLYDTLADLMANNKLYQTSQGYFVTTPDSIRLGEFPSLVPEGRSLLMTTAEALSMVHGEITTVREGARTHQGIQTNLADVICGGNKNDKILYPRTPSKSHTPRKLERRHSMRLLGSSRRLATLHRAGSVRLLQHTSNTAETTTTTKKCSLLSRLFRWPKRQSSAPVSTFQDEYPPQEWFNSTVLHLHSVGTQTQNPTNGESEWAHCGQVQTRRRSLSTSRLPRRHNQSRAGSASRPSSPSTVSSSKTVLCNTTPKSMSSASSGYNSLPRSVKSKSKQSSISAQNTPKSSPRHASKNTIKVEVSANQVVETESAVDARLTTRINDPTATMTTTINGPNATKIFVQQHNSPIRSVITFENGRKPPISKEKPLGKEEKERVNGMDTIKKLKRPASLYQQKEKATDLVGDKNNEIFGHLENHIKMKFPSTETIQLEEKLLQSHEKNIKNLCHKKEFFGTSNNALKAGSLVDVANFFANDSEKNNVRKASLSLSPLQPAQSSDKAIESLSFKNVLKDSEVESSLKKEGIIIANKTTVKKITSTPIDNSKEMLDKQEQDLNSFPSLSDLSVHFTSIAAQNILKGVSINSIDTLVEVNMAAEKQNLNRDVSFHTDLGIV